MASYAAAAQLEQELTRLNWTWNHPKVQTYIQEVAIRFKRPIPTPLDASDKVIIRLSKFLNLYYQCQNIINVLPINWQDPQIVAVFQKYDYPDRLPMEGWEELLKMLDKRWFESGGAF